jgi:hypothetical protein
LDQSATAVEAICNTTGREYVISADGQAASVAREDNNVSEEKAPGWTDDRPPASDPAMDWRELRRQEKAQRRGYRRGGGAWIGGVILIFLGLLFMLQNFGILVGGHWWALFIMIPAIALLSAAWRAYAWSGGLTPAVTGPLLGGIGLMTVSLIFLLGLNWAVVWPIFLILGGLGALASGAFQRR